MLPAHRPAKHKGGVVTTTVESLTEQSVSISQTPAPPTKSHLSFSAIKTMADCGKRYQLQRVLELPETPGYAALAGRAVHAATEDYDRKLYLATGT